VDHVVIGTSSRLEAAVEEQETSAKEQEDVEEDQVTADDGKYLPCLGAAMGGWINS
jgi:hypothetical protein